MSVEKVFNITLLKLFCYTLILFLGPVYLYAGSFAFNDWRNDYLLLIHKRGDFGQKSLGVWPIGMREAKLLSIKKEIWLNNLLFDIFTNDNTIDQSDYSETGISLSSGFRENVKSVSPNISIFSQSWVRLLPKLSFFLRIRATSDIHGIPSFTGIDRGSRFGFKAAEADYFVLNYEGKYGGLSFGRMRHEWSAEPGGSLLLSSTSSSYDGGSGYLKYGPFSLYFVSAYLESFNTADSSYMTHRYLAGHYLTFKNKGLLLSLGESIIYAGKNRPFDVVYTIPFMTYVEADYNKRFNQVGPEIDNALIHFSMRYQFINKWSIFGEFIVDELQIDSEDSKKYPNAMGYRCGFNIPFGSILKYSVLSVEYASIGTWVYRYHQEYGNYASRGISLGWPDGSDIKKVQISWLGLPFSKLYLRANCFYSRSGEENFIYNIYNPEVFEKRSFPSGVVEEQFGFLTVLRYQPRQHLRIEFFNECIWMKNENHISGRESNIFRIGIKFETDVGYSFFPKSFIKY